MPKIHEMKENQKYIWIEIWDWLLINLIVPVLIPYIFVFMSKLLVHLNKDYFEVFKMLLNDGVYTFVGLMLTFSLLQDYRFAKNAFTIWFWGWFLTSMLCVGMIFISSLGLITSEDAVTFKDNQTLFLTITGVNILLSVFFKYNIIQTRRNNASKKIIN